MGTSNRSKKSGIQRLRWTQELRDRFEEAVTQLGGADRATPKCILKAMSLPGVTIDHVKSHLQKYRDLKLTPESFDKGKPNKWKLSELLPNFSVTSGAQIKEVLKLQLDLQWRLSDQIEVQRHLKFRVEAQGRYLERVTGEQWNLPVKGSKLQNHYLSSVSFPSPFEGPESNPRKHEHGSSYDLAGGLNVKTLNEATKISPRSTIEVETTLYERFQSHKRQKVENLTFPGINLSSFNMTPKQQEVWNGNVLPKELQISSSTDGIYITPVTDNIPKIIPDF